MRSFLTLLFLSLLSFGMGQNHTLQLANAKLPSARANVGTFYDGEDTIYIFGGYQDRETYYADVQRYNVTSDEIDFVGFLPVAGIFGVNNQIARRSDGVIFIFYENDEEFGLVAEFDPATGVIRQGPNMSHIFLSNSPMVQTSENSVSFFGNWYSNFQGNVLELDLNTYEITWKNDTIMTDPYLFTGLPLTLHGTEQVFLFAQQSTERFCYITIYTPKEGTHTWLTNIPRSLEPFRALRDSVTGDIFVVDGDDQLEGRILVIHPESLTFDFIPVAGLAGRNLNRGHAYVEKMKRIYFFGGYVGSLRNDIWYVDLELQN